ncbi:PH domain-containing protein [Nocardioides taihuensis]|uniref:PH domain-containing protein n=1 Tax=Nocardioides taihuensis TaxID=1835606 RepID=A0ABW0BRN8_9ACTN
MPAASDPPAVDLPHTWRPLGVRLAGAVFGAALFAVCAFAWFGFDADVRARFNPLELITIVGLGAMFYAAGFALARSRVVATAERLVVVNGYRRREYEWAEVVAISLPPGAPWAVLDLADGTSASAMGIQGSDGTRARTQVRELRAVLARATSGPANSG